VPTREAISDTNSRNQKVYSRHSNRAGFRARRRVHVGERACFGDGRRINRVRSMNVPPPIDWTGIDWQDLYPRLMLVAGTKLKRLSWRGRRFGAIPGAATSKDIVHDAIVKTISGQRVWNREVPLLHHLVGVISSEVSHLAMSADNRRILDPEIIPIADHREDPEVTAIRNLQEQNFLVYLEKKKPELRQLAELILYDPSSRSERLSVKLNMSSVEVESLKKALRRATEEYLKSEARQKAVGAQGPRVPNQSGRPAVAFSGLDVSWQAYLFCLDDQHQSEANKGQLRN
jgi:hypothetical protein